MSNFEPLGGYRKQPQIKVEKSHFDQGASQINMATIKSRDFDTVEYHQVTLQDPMPIQMSHNSAITSKLQKLSVKNNQRIMEL